VGYSIVLRMGRCLLAQTSDSKMMVVNNFKTKSGEFQEEMSDARVGKSLELSRDIRCLYHIHHKLLLMRNLVSPYHVVMGGLSKHLIDSCSWEKL
jgi:hypothetical protein